jgi:hypothetical protein
MLSIDSPEDEETRYWIALFLRAMRTDADLVPAHAEGVPDKPVGVVIDLAAYRQWKTFNEERTKV